MFKFSPNPDSTIAYIRTKLRDFGIRRLSRATGIPITTVSRTVRHLNRARFKIVLTLVSASMADSD